MLFNLKRKKNVSAWTANLLVEDIYHAKEGDTVSTIKLWKNTMTS
ncbi:hypothetical protein X813_gp48 [Lactobacillus phage LL-Ku]|uniref:Uncharacterized protein n=1 Tax=Lactobacillus phage LL-Ku TaxID=2892343 RepID=F7V9E8_9CAUD|nr:hypothetical protein X813_gp48 [Lactobacillus phage LL-Ku]AAV30209.1 hypothetical protein [Lactobacillus phage LL-Ku]